MSLTLFKFNVDVLKIIGLIVKCNSSSNVNQNKSFLLHYLYDNSLTECLSICSRHTLGRLILASVEFCDFQVQHVF